MNSNFCNSLFAQLLSESLSIFVIYSMPTDYHPSESQQLTLLKVVRRLLVKIATRGDQIAFNLLIKVTSVVLCSTIELSIYIYNNIAITIQMT